MTWPASLEDITIPDRDSRAELLDRMQQNHDVINRQPPHDASYYSFTSNKQNSTACPPVKVSHFCLPCFLRHVRNYDWQYATEESGCSNCPHPEAWARSGWVKSRDRTTCFNIDIHLRVMIAIFLSYDMDVTAEVLLTDRIIVMTSPFRSVISARSVYFAKNTKDT